MACRLSRLMVVNAPAGSGKSTEIKRLAQDWSAAHPLDRMLCVTYTNRAADELKADLSNPNVDVSTIHSFYNTFARPLFASPVIVALYFEVYEDRVVERILNVDNRPHIADSNDRYRETLGEPLSLELIRDSVKSLYYTESPFNTLFRGGLSHDDLLSFIGVCAERYPKIFKRINSKYRQIILDEYQDTQVSVLDFFLHAVAGTETGLHLYGDRMQQIYSSSSTKFREILDQFQVSGRTVTNYRSSSAIVSTLNKIYNDASLTQTPNDGNHSEAPRARISSAPRLLESRLSDDTTLILSVHNSTIFESLGAPRFLKEMKSFPGHEHGSQHPAVSVISEPDWEQVQNPLVKLLYGLLQLEEHFERKVFGSAIQMLRKYPRLFGAISLQQHHDKVRLSEGFTTVFAKMKVHETTIREIVEQVGSLDFLRPADLTEYFGVEEIAGLLEVPFGEVRKAYDFNQNPRRSTQHGVKGESHESIIFMAENSNSTPVVHMDRLFNIWPRIDLDLEMLEAFAAQISSSFEHAELEVGQSVSKLNAGLYGPIADKVQATARSIYSAYSASPLFAEIYEDTYTKYFAKPNVTNAKNLFKSSAIDGLVSAYKLFYVGCSRARTHLDVIIDSAKLENVSATETKLRELGFEVSLHFDE
jgi:DNA helicase-2/ATP-dependent DNA helicase PcrA